MCPTPPNDQDEIGAVLALAISAVASLVGIWPLGVVVSVSFLSNCESFCEFNHSHANWERRWDEFQFMYNPPTSSDRSPD